LTLILEKATPQQWLKLYKSFRDAGASKEKAIQMTEEALGPKPKGVVLKSEEEVEHAVEVVKVDADLGLVFGYGIICKVKGEEYFDLQGDYIPEDEMMKSATEFMETARAADVMHDYEKQGTVVFAWPMTAEVAKSFGVETKVTGLMIAVKPEPEMLAKFKSGELKGFSIGGRGIRTPVQEEAA